MELFSKVLVAMSSPWVLLSLIVPACPLRLPEGDPVLAATK